ncbi:MAG: hypothetical protein HYV03_08480 [Deltaproteobacteria bacterium]|nr:hypothetical protein [Deltaproteobacteria bacterium]
MKRLFQRLRRPKFWIPGLIVAGVIAALCAAGVVTYHYIEHEPKFCVSCHTMAEPFQQWQVGTHAMVNCHECHRHSKIESLKQLWMYVTLRPDKVIHHPELDHTVCVRCHATDSQRWHDIRETAGHKVHVDRAGIECLDCHDQGIHNIARPEGVCVTCHTDKAAMGNKMAFVHCLQCHNFLATEKGVEGIFPTRANCLECHEKIRTESGMPHWERTPSECTTCHRPHEEPSIK